MVTLYHQAIPPLFKVLISSVTHPDTNSIQIVFHFSGETATCMYNSPHETESLARVLPGKLLTLDAQCRKDRGTSACFKDDRVCAQLFCFDAASGYCVSYRPAAEGSRCGDGAVIAPLLLLMIRAVWVTFPDYASLFFARVNLLRMRGLLQECRRWSTPQ